HRLAISMPLATALACLLVALFALPSSLMGSLYSDIRLGPAIALVAISTLDIRADAPRVITNAVAAVVLLLSCVQTAVLSSVWIHYGSETEAIVRALDRVERGATLFSVTSEPFARLIADNSERIAAWNPPLKHVASYAVLHAPVFVPMTFADPTKQPLIVLPAYRSVKEFQGDNPILLPDRQTLNGFLARL